MTKFKIIISSHPLAHAPYLHREGGILVKKALQRAKEERRNILLDKTFSDLKKGKEILNEFKKEDYDIHLKGTQLPTELSIERATDRFLKKGRYVPLGFIAKEGNKINENVLKARKLDGVDSYEIFDVRPKLIFKSKKKDSFNFR